MSQERKEQEIRWSKVENAKASIKAGLYDEPEALDVLAEVILESFSN